MITHTDIQNGKKKMGSIFGEFSDIIARKKLYGTKSNEPT